MALEDILQRTDIPDDVKEQIRVELARQRTAPNLLKEYIHHSPVHTFIKEVTPTESRVIIASENFTDMIGISGSNMTGKTMYELFPAEFAAKIIADDWNVVSRGEVFKLDESLNGRNYTTIKYPIAYDNKTLLAGYSIDVTEQKQAEEQLRQSEQKLKRQNNLFSSLIQLLPPGVFMVEAPSGKPLLANEAACNLLGRGILPDAIKHNLSEVYKAYKKNTKQPYPPDEMPIVRGMHGEKSYIDDMIIERPDGSTKLLEIFGSPVLDNEGRIWASLVSFSDITEREKIIEELKRKTAQFEYASIHDALTGIYNRRYFDMEKQRLAVSRRIPVSVVIIDINDLKLINDTYGHHAGDVHITETAHFLRDTFRLEDMVARIGGDEFGVLLPETEYNECAHIVDRLLVQREIYIDKTPRSIPLSFAIGFDTNITGFDIDEAQKRADSSMYHQKNGREEKNK